MTSTQAVKPFNCYMARQPIFDRRNNVVAYEMLYRKSKESSQANMTVEDEMRALSNVLVDMGVNFLAKNLTAYVNVPPSMLESDILQLLPQNKVILEVLEEVEYSDSVRDMLVHLTSCGYQIALDDFKFDPKHIGLIPYVNLIKVDVMEVSTEDLQRYIPKLKQMGKVLLAEKVETREMHSLCLELGFDLFQGYYFSKPELMKSVTAGSNVAGLLSLLGRLQDPKITVDSLHDLISSDVALCQKILRLVHSAAYAMGGKLESLRQAILFLGTQKIRTLVQLAIVTSIYRKPTELCELSVVRARFCERVAQTYGLESPDMHFTTGLLSLLDAITDSPMEEAVAGIQLKDPILDALLGRGEEVFCRRTLNLAVAYEKGDWKNVTRLFPELPSGIYEEAVQWAATQSQLLAA